MFRPVTTVVVGDTTFKYIGSRLFAKKSHRGWTIFHYVNNRLDKEVSPGGLTGKYIYGAGDLLQSVVYSDGRTISVTYGANGKIRSAKSSTAWTAVFHPTTKTGKVPAVSTAPQYAAKRGSIAAALAFKAV